MASEAQIQANRRNAKKSTGPKTPEGKRISSRNALPSLKSGTVVLTGESLRRFNQLAAAFILHFQPRNPAETCLVQTMTVSRWHLLRIWGIQTADFETEMANALRKTHSSKTSPAAIAAAAFRSLADNSGASALQQRFAAAYDRQFHWALASLLKLRELPDETAFGNPAIQLSTQTWKDNFEAEAPHAEAPNAAEMNADHTDEKNAEGMVFQEIFSEAISEAVNQEQKACNK